jgi:hypothetical protein
MLGLWALLRGYLGWIGRRVWSPVDRRAGLFFTVSLDLQLLLGLALALTSPLAATLWRDPGAAMAMEAARYFVLEHVPLMLVGLVLAHVGSTRARRGERARGKHRQAALWYSLSMLSILVAIPWWRPLLRGLSL